MSVSFFTHSILSYSIQMDSPPLVKAAASIMKELCYNNKEELQAGFITAGWDRKKGPQVMLVNGIHADDKGNSLTVVHQSHNCQIFSSKLQNNNESIYY